jgi:hypothetical protein
VATYFLLNDLQLFPLCLSTPHGRKKELQQKYLPIQKLDLKLPLNNKAQLLWTQFHLHQKSNVAPISVNLEQSGTQKLQVSTR